MTLKSTSINKILRIILSAMLLFQSFGPALLFSPAVVFAQEETGSTTPTPTVTAESTTTPIPTETSAPTPTITITPEVTPEPSVTNTPPPTPTPQENGELNTFVAQNIEADSVDLEAIDPENVEQTAKLATDKADYAPTDTAIISGTGFIAGQAYILKIFSTDTPPVTHEVEVTADENGQFVYAYQLDGTSRPNYTIVAKTLSGEEVAQTSFTDKVNTATTLNNISTPLTAWQTGVAFSGQVTKDSGGDAPTGNVELRYLLNTCSQGSSGTLLATAASAGSFSGTFTAPVAGIYNFWAYYVGNSGHNPSSSACQTRTVSAAPTDTTSPVISKVVTGTSGSNDWYTSDVTVAWTVTDPESSVVIDSGCGTQTFTSETTGVTSSCAAHSAGGSSSDSVNLKIDKTAPVISVTGTNPVTIEVHSSYTDADATVTDNLDPSVTVTSSGSVNKDIVGDYTIYYDAADVAGNHAVQKSRIVHVVDTTNPVILLVGANPQTIEVFHAYTELGATASDNYDGNITGSIVINKTAVDTNTVGSYTVTYDVADSNGNHATQVTRTVNVIKANQTITFGSLSDKTYGNPDFDVTATATSGLTVEFIASGDCTMADADTVHITGAGSCTITAQQAGNGSYNPAPDVPQSFNIAKADATIVVTPYDVTYDGNAHTGTGSAKGVKNEVLSGLDLSGTTHTNAGFYKDDSWTFTDITGKYNDASGKVDDNIKKADATCSIDGYTGVYDAASHGATGSCKGVKGETLSGLDLGASFTNVPGDTADWTYTDAIGNYNNDSGSVSIVITKADAIVTVNGYTGVYDGNAHGATGTATGVGSVDLSAGLNLGATFTDVPGGIAHWTFTGGTNYLDEGDDAAIVISKADAKIVVTPYDVTYDGDSHTATGIATGVKDEILSGLDLSGTTHTNAGFYKDDSWTFTDVTGNYNDASGKVDNNIKKADATISVTPYDVIYDGNSHTATGSATSVKGESLSGLDLSGTTHTYAGTYNDDAWIFTDVTGNYNDTSGAINDKISPAVTTISINAPSVQYSDPITLSATVSPVTIGDQTVSGSVEFFISGLSVGSSTIDGTGVATVSGISNPRAANDYGVKAVFTSTNSNFASNEGTGTLSVTKEDAAITYNGDTSVFSAGPTITSAPIRLSAHLDQLDTNLGDLTLAKVTFVLTPAGGGSPITVDNIPVSAVGDVITTKQVPVGVYSVNVTISSGNLYWTQNPYGEGILDVVLGSNEQRVTGGGWISDAKSANGKDNFGFTVNYNKNGAPKGNFLFMFRGTDGYNYQLKSNSWAKGGLSFTSDNTAFFTAKATLSKIDRATGQVISSDGNYTFVVNIQDLDYNVKPVKTPDTFAITIFDSSNNIWKQVGTAGSPITLGGGNVVVHSK